MVELGQVWKEHTTLHGVESVTRVMCVIRDEVELCVDVRSTVYPDGIAACSVPQCNSVINALGSSGIFVAVKL